MADRKRYTDSEIRLMSPLNLAYIGDSVFDLYIREFLLERGRNLKTSDLHRQAVKYVSAGAQSAIMEMIENELTEEEVYFYKRGRNQKSGHMPKNASAVDYKRATGFETLIGYLYLSGREDRLSDILRNSAIKTEEYLNETK